MISNELSLVRFCTMNFFATILSSRPFQPISSLLVKLVEALISSEPEPDISHRNRVNWIYTHTHKRVMEHLSIVELAVFKNLDKGLNREIEIADKTFYLVELYNILDEVTKELTNIVISIAKKYSLDMPLLNMGKVTSQTINLNE